MSMVLVELAVVAVIAVLGAGILFGLIVHPRGIRHRARPLQIHNLGGPIFLFQDKMLVDATPDAISMITPHSTNLSEFDATLHVLTPHFPDLRNRIALQPNGYTRIEDDRDDGLWIDLDKRDGQLRLAIKGELRAKRVGVNDVIERDVRLSELAMLRDMTHHTPQLIWREDKAGKLVWANHAFLSFSDQLQERGPDGQSTWPSVSVFADIHESLIKRGTSNRRVSVTLPDKKAEHWFDVTSVARDDGFMHFATDANAVVRADQDRRNFVQTLSKTFADLSIGLAIFDKRRQLAMFNPAMQDLTRLPIGFLSSRPTIDMVLDRMRESRMLPEPKNYASWRDQFTAVEAAAKNGTYCENWNLPDGQTYRVTGRPHPDGAFAFLFEDISAEISLTRRFRSDIETAQAVLDTLPDAIAVFSSQQTLVISNSAYTSLWQSRLGLSIEHRELDTEIELWRKGCVPSPIWTEMRDFIQTLGARKPWSDEVILEDGRLLQCAAVPIAGGMTMVRFSLAPVMKPVMQKLTMPDPAIRIAQR